MNLQLLASTTVQIVTHRVETSWEWYIVRAAGFVAAFLIVLLVLSGIGQVTGFTYRFIEPIKAWTIHKAMAIALVVSIALHIIFLLLDHYIKFTIPQVLIPFLSHYNNTTQLFGLALGGLAISFGVLAMYGVVILVASSLGWIDTHKRAWRKLHYISYLVALLVFFHVIYSGTDVKYGMFRFAWLFIGCIVIIGIISRLLRSGLLRNNGDSD